MLAIRCIKQIAGWLLVGLAVGYVPGAQAAQVEGLYQAQVPVKTQTREERLEVYPAALAQVVVKLSGDRSVPELPELSGLMGNAVSLVQQFQYAELPPGDETLLEDGYKRLLVARFDGQAVSQALIEANVPLWGSTRPEVLLWLAIEDRETRYLLGANAAAELESRLEAQAARRGLPLMLPLLDLDDRRQVDFGDVWGDFHHTVMQASARYSADTVLIGRLIRAEDGAWRTRWSLHYAAAPNTPSEFWQAQVNSQEEALAVGIDGAADRIARRYAQLYSPDSADSVALTVTGVGGMAGYARAMDYLESLDIVTAVEVARVRQEEVLFRVAIRGDARGLEQSIRLGSTLARDAEAQPPAENELTSARTFVYRLLP
ncbi:hypothetical protein Tel_04720 [Candidatus Tenderia electrophaga]|uniref:DUF2066 domain-containing protein n=1 Tax=Candidatus Tenderia electrophaga TaxID=1748243 RepID=A0A0S2TBJ4_9GAMM|nr:hypothetical protein Tel_04720 [Candidatus Tenderia electrophaga]